MTGRERATVSLASWVADVGRSGVSDSVAMHVRRLLADYLAAVVVGSQSAVSKMLGPYLAEVHPGHDATVVGGRLNAPGAAFANGTAAHAFDVDDGYTPGSVHPSAVAISAALAAAERYKAPTETALAAAAVGVEVTCRVARAGHPATWRRGFHNTAIAGVIGAAAGSCVVLGASEEQVVNALGLAGSHAGGLFEFLGTGAEVKRIHAGKAARDGLLCAEFARRGVTGPVSVLEGQRGYFHAFAGGDWSPDALLDGLSDTWELRRTYVKPYPCCRHLHGPIDAVLAMTGRDPIDLGQIRQVVVRTYATAAEHRLTDFDALLDAQMSMPFVLAVALRDHEVGLQQFGRDHREDPVIRDVASRVRVELDGELDAAYPRERAAVVEVQLTDGSRRVETVRQPYGEPDNPMSDEALREKFARLCAPVLGDQRAADLWRACMRARKISDVTDLLLAPVAAGIEVPT